MPPPVWSSPACTNVGIKLGWDGRNRAPCRQPYGQINRAQVIKCCCWYYKNIYIYTAQDRLSSLLKTAENLKVKGLAEVSGDEKEKTEAKPSPGPAVSRLSSGPPPMTMMGRGAPAGTSQENNNSQTFTGFVNINGELKKKRGRPRTLDGPEDEESSVFSPRISSVTGGVNGSSSMSPILSQSLSSSSSFLQTKTLSPLQAALSKPLSEPGPTSKDNSNSSPPSSKPTTPCPSSPTTIKTESLDSNRNCDTPGAASVNGTFIPTLSAELVASWGIIKMNDYLVSGTRQQYWEEYFVKNVMAVSSNHTIFWNEIQFQINKNILFHE